MKLLDIYSAVPLDNGLLEVVVKVPGTGVLAPDPWNVGEPSLASANTRTFTWNAFWFHRIDGDEPLIYQLAQAAYDNYYGLGDPSNGNLPVWLFMLHHFTDANVWEPVRGGSALFPNF